MRSGAQARARFETAGLKWPPEDVAQRIDHDPESAAECDRSAQGIGFAGGDRPAADEDERRMCR